MNDNVWLSNIESSLGVSDKETVKHCKYEWIEGWKLQEDFIFPMRFGRIVMYQILTTPREDDGESRLVFYGVRESHKRFGLAAS